MNNIFLPISIYLRRFSSFPIFIIGADPFRNNYANFSFEYCVSGLYYKSFYSLKGFLSLIYLVNLYFECFYVKLKSFYI